MKNYDYKDEGRDVKGKVIFKSFNFINLIHVDRETQRNPRAPTNALGLEKCDGPNHSQLGRGHANDRKEYIQTPAQR